MLDVEEPTQTQRPSSLTQWAYSAIGRPDVSLKVRLRGNDLHILCDCREHLDAQTVVNRLLKALRSPKERAKLPVTRENPIYQIIIYGRTVGHQRPDWIKQIRLKPTTNTNPETSLIISNEDLARSGSPEAIARYLSETLSFLGVSVKVFIKEYKEEEPDSSESAITGAPVGGITTAQAPPSTASGVTSGFEEPTKTEDPNPRLRLPRLAVFGSFAMPITAQIFPYSQSHLLSSCGICSSKGSKMR